MKPAVTDPPEVHRALWEGFTGHIGWDIGANCGQTLDEMKTRFDTVVAFEPALECRPYLDTFTDVEMWYVGLSDVDGPVDLVALPDKIDTGQLVTAGTQGMEWNPDDPAATVRQVQCFTVDTMVHTLVIPPDFLKIDVEGHELKVLFGARQTLAIHRPDILLEFHSKDLHRSCVDLLESYGYHTQTLRHPHYYPGTDLWFTHGWVKAKQNVTISGSAGFQVGHGNVQINVFG